MTADDFWASKMAAPSAPENLTPGEQYRAWQRAKSGGNGASGSRIYDLYPTSEQRANRAPRSYYSEDAGYEGLGQYQREVASKWARQAKETDEAYLQRTNGLLRHLDEMNESDRSLILAIRDSITNREVAESWDEHRAVVDGRAAGISGQQGQGNRAFGRGMSERTIEGQGHLLPESNAGAPMSSALAYANARAYAEAQRGQVPQRPVITGSSGEGWTVSG